MAARLCWDARIGRSTPIGTAGTLESAARDRSVPLGTNQALEFVVPIGSCLLPPPPLNFYFLPLGFYLPLPHKIEVLFGLLKVEC